jgi:anti-sigma regulatory factor (Ser/Thr protein kinase)
VQKADINKIHAEGKDHGLGVDVYRRVMDTTYKKTRSGKNCLTLRIAKHHEKNV